MFRLELHIPKERVAVLVGKKGSTKKQIQSTTGTRLQVSAEGDVVISSEDNLNNYITLSIVRAIGRGFNPITALALWKEENSLEVVDIREFAGRSKRKAERLRSRVIGAEGKARMMLERLTNASISVYGKTVAVIGKTDDAITARHAVEKLLQGAPHGNVYKYIEKQKKRFL